MTGGDDIRRDLEPGAPAELLLVAARLQRERPVPAAGFRGDLRRRLQAVSWRPRPARLRVLIAGYAVSGAAFLLAGALSALGVGPLGA